MIYNSYFLEKVMDENSRSVERQARVSWWKCLGSKQEARLESNQAASPAANQPSAHDDTNGARRTMTPPCRA